MKDSDDEGAEERPQNQIEKSRRSTSKWNRRNKTPADLAFGVGPIPSEGTTERAGESEEEVMMKTGNDILCDSRSKRFFIRMVKTSSQVAS